MLFRPFTTLGSLTINTVADGPTPMELVTWNGISLTPRASAAMFSPRFNKIRRETRGVLFYILMLKEDLKARGGTPMACGME